MFKFKDYNFKRIDIWLIAVIVALSLLGLAILSSAMMYDSDYESTIAKQKIGVIVGLAVMAFIAICDYHFLLKIAPVILIIGLALLAGVLIPGVGTSSNNAARWISLGGIQIQPSEFIKPVIIVFFAWMYSKFNKKINHPFVVVGSVLIFAMTAALMLMEPDLSTTIVCTIVFVCLLFVSKVSYKWLVPFLLIAVGAVVAIIIISLNGGGGILKDYQVNRILSWLYPEQYASTGLTTQQDNSVMAIASGQLYGKGLYNSSLASMKAGGFLVEGNTDFIFAVVGEEMGFLGCLLIIALLAFAAFYCLYLSSKAKDMGGRLICAGVGTLIAFQTFVNIGVSTGLLPNTGLPLPFISAGLSSLMSTYICMGLVLNVGLQKRVETTRLIL